MIKMMKPFVTILFFALMFVGCSATSQVPTGQADDPALVGNPFELGENGDGMVLEASISYESLVRSVSFDGSPIDVTYEFDNLGSPFDFRLLVFIDGVLQAYRSDRNAEDGYLQAFHLERDEHAEIRLSIDPTVGTKGQTLYLRTMLVHNPFFQPDLSKPVIFGHSLGCGGENYIPVEYLADSRSAGASPAVGAGGGHARVEDISPKTKAFYAEHGLSFDEPRLALEGLETSLQSVTVGDSCQVAITGIGGMGQDYRLYVFCNLEPYMFEEGFPYVDFPIREGKATYVDIDLDLSALGEGDTVSIFGLAVPLADDPDNHFILSRQTERFLLIKG